MAIAVGTTTIVTLIVAAVSWLRHGFAVVSPETGCLTKVLVTILSAELLFVATGFFLAIGAAIATSIAVIAAATLGGLSTEQGVVITGVAFSIGMGVPTAMLAATAARPR